jgi:O-antigen/teichoic acid export membrane protein
MASKLTSTVLRNSMFGAAAQIAIKVLSFGFSILVVRQLGVEAFGQYAAVLAFGAVFVFFADLGLSPYTVRAVARWRDVPEGAAEIQNLYGQILVLRLLLALLATAMIIVTAWMTKRPPLMVTAIAINAIGLLLYSVQGASDAVLAGYERLDVSASARVIYQLIFVVLGALALIWHGSYFGLIGANLIGIAVLTWICWRSVQRLGVRPGRINPQLWVTLIRASLPFGIIGLTLGLSYKFDSVLLNITWGDTATGYYNAAYNLVFSAVMLSNVFNTALYPSLARHSVHHPDSLRGIYTRSLRYSFGLALPIALGCTVLAEPLVLLLFGADFLPAAPALAIIIWAVPFMFLTELCGYIVVIAGKEKLVARSILVSTAVNIGANLILVPRYGFMAAAVMTVVTEIVLLGQYIWLLRSQIGLSDWASIIIRPLLAALCMAAVVYGLRHLPVPVTILIGAVSYGMAGWLFGVFGKDELAFVRTWRDQRRSAAVL